MTECDRGGDHPTRRTPWRTQTAVGGIPGDPCSFLARLSDVAELAVHHNDNSNPKEGLEVVIDASHNDFYRRDEGNGCNAHGESSEW